jgi:hypothetical protein
MYEIHMAVAAIRVDGKTFADICTKIPIADIFHSGRRRRRRDAAAADQSSYSAAELSTNSSAATLITINETAALQDGGAILAAELELAEDTAEGAAATEKEEEEEEEEGDHYDSLWSDYDYDEELKAKAETERGRLRIDFAKYGPKLAGQKRVDESKVDLPDDIYCDLVDSLKDICLQSSLLEIWRYDRCTWKYCTTLSIY